MLGITAKGRINSLYNKRSKNDSKIPLNCDKIMKRMLPYATNTVTVFTACNNYW